MKYKILRFIVKAKNFFNPIWDKTAGYRYIMNHTGIIISRLTILLLGIYYILFELYPSSISNILIDYIATTKIVNIIICKFLNYYFYKTLSHPLSDIKLFNELKMTFSYSVAIIVVSSLTALLTWGIIILISYWYHRKILGLYLHKDVNIIRPLSAINDLKFISTWVVISIIINIIILCILFDNMIINFIYILFTQSLIFYFMVKMKFFNYQLIRNNNKQQRKK